MTHRTIRMIIEGQVPVTAPADITVAKAARLMQQNQVGALMIVDRAGKLAGVFTERDALFRVLAAGLDGTHTPIADVMTARPLTIGPDQHFAHALSMMHDGGFRHVPVVEGGKPVGMVSARDALGPELEAFVYELLRQEQVSQILA